MYKGVACCIHVWNILRRCYCSLLLKIVQVLGHAPLISSFAHMFLHCVYNPGKTGIWNNLLIVKCSGSRPFQAFISNWYTVFWEWQLQIGMHSVFICISIWTEEIPAYNRYYILNSTSSFSQLRSSIDPWFVLWFAYLCASFNCNRQFDRITTYSVFAFLIMRWLTRCLHNVTGEDVMWILVW